jgi:hypothetical protein
VSAVRRTVTLLSGSEGFRICTREETKALLPTPEQPVRILVDSFRHISDHGAVR